MQLVINIPKGRYEDILSGKEFTLYQCDVREVLKNGTPLPKGHGRLIEASKLLDTDRIIVDNSGCHYIPMIYVYEAPTIIEADKGEEYDIR